MLEITIPSEDAYCNILRQYLMQWEKDGKAHISRVAGIHLLWLHSEGDTLLWPWPTLRHKVGDLVIDSVDVPARRKVYFNEVAADVSASPAFFWGRNPGALQRKSLSGRLPFAERDIESIFIGKIGNKIQERHRSTHDWSACVELYSMIGPGETYLYTQDEYLDLMARARFGLSLRGYGPKCNREIELMALGTVPVVMSDVDMSDYRNPPQEGVHFLRADSPGEFLERIRSVSQSDWERMSLAGVQWYRENSSFDGALRVMEEIASETTGRAHSP